MQCETEQYIGRERERETWRDMEIHWERDRETERDRERQRDRERETVSQTDKYIESR